ncbi:MAG: histidine phosphatase family protein [Pseudomonadota bacterium]|nr:histidine phosphatase family protein [Pseudomonadota bacterium]
MARVIAAIIRHGDYHQLADTPSAHQPFPLNADGEQHARNAAGNILEVCKNNGWEPVSAIDCSRMLRAWQTAHIIAGRIADTMPFSPALESYDALAERGVGSAANLTIGQIRQVLREDPRFPEPPADWKSDSRYRLPLQGAESLLEAGERVAGHLVQRMKELGDETSIDRLKLFVGHGAAFRHAAYHLGVLEFSQISRLSMHHGHPVYLEYLPGGSWRHIRGEWKSRAQKNRFMD